MEKSLKTRKPIGQRGQIHSHYTVESLFPLGQVFSRLKSEVQQLKLSWTDLTADTRLLCVQSLIHPQSDNAFCDSAITHVQSFVHILWAPTCSANVNRYVKPNQTQKVDAGGEQPFECAKCLHETEQISILETLLQQLLPMGIPPVELIQHSN